MSYIFDKVLDPPQTPLTTIIPGDDISETERLQDHFNGSLSAGWKVVYRQDYAKHQKVFLCSDWAYLRLKDKLRPNQMFPYDDFVSDDTTKYSVKEYAAKLNAEFQLVECTFDDPNRICIIWSSRGNEKSVGHIQVKYKGNWESKLSTEYWVITHGEDDFKHLDGWDLKKMRAFKRK